ncbi:MAG: CHAD domain-containing protein, partial [Longimicrobiales bacterium]
KDLRHALEFLEPGWPAVFRPLVDELHALTDRLGDANDLTLVLERLATDPPLVAPADRPLLEAVVRDARRARWQAATPMARTMWAPDPAALAGVIVAWAGLRLPDQPDDTG